MKKCVLAIAICAAAVQLATAAQPAGPSASWPIVPITAPMDRAYPGEIQLTVDASDTGRRIVHVHESLSGIGTGTILLYPKWLPGSHAPEGPIDKIAGIRITAKGTPAAIAPVLPHEVRATVRNHLAGKIEQWFFQTEGYGVVFIVNATSTAEAHELLEKLPLGVAGMMEFELIALGPLAPLAMLIGEPPRS